MNIGDVMDEIAERLRQAPSLAGRTHAYPVATLHVPGAVVEYPTDGTFDETYGRGFDRMNGVVTIYVGNPAARQTRDLLTKYMDGSGPESVKALIDGDNGSYTSCDAVRVKDWVTAVNTLSGNDYLCAVFNLDIAGQGA